MNVKQRQAFVHAPNFTPFKTFFTKPIKTCATLRMINALNYQQFQFSYDGLV